MYKLLFGTFICISIAFIGGCSVKNSSSCIGCKNLPECVPGPYGDCLPQKK